MLAVAWFDLQRKGMGIAGSYLDFEPTGMRIVKSYLDFEPTGMKIVKSYLEFSSRCKCKGTTMHRHRTAAIPKFSLALHVMSVHSSPSVCINLCSAVASVKEMPFRRFISLLLPIDCTISVTFLPAPHISMNRCWHFPPIRVSVGTYHIGILL